MDHDRAFKDAVSNLWRIPALGPEDLFTAREFAVLSDLCQARYGAKTTFALYYALRSLGVPCLRPNTHQNQTIDPCTAAKALNHAFTRTTTVRRHICPLDLADSLPALQFGEARVAKFPAKDLETRFDAPRLARVFPSQSLESVRLAQFHWLVVEEKVELVQEPELRAVPGLDFDMLKDFGEIDPHLGRFPTAVENALFFLILAPWEAYSTMPQVDWRAFRVPWIYTLDEDLFVFPGRPPSADSLSLEPWYVEDADGKSIELERPTVLQLSNSAQAGVASLTDTAWKDLQAARKTPLFQTPIVHFFVRAFLSDGMDEVMAHMTALEAAVGLESDQRSSRRQRPDPHLGLPARERIANRIAAAVGNAQARQEYLSLFDIRSAYIHGRAGLKPVSTDDRVLARRLARQVIQALVRLAKQTNRTREAELANLLDTGCKMTGTVSAKSSP